MKKVVFVVLAGMLLTFGLVSSAMAIDSLKQNEPVVINPGATGDALIYGYYNVRTSLNLFTIVNTSSTAGAKVRFVFRAGADSEEVLDFAVCLSENDVWTAFLINNGTTAAICTSSLLDTDTVTSPTLTGCNPFIIPAGSTLTNNDLQEGYFEALGFSSLPGYDKNSSTTTAPVAGDVTNLTFQSNYIHTATDCANWYDSATSSSDVAGVVGNVLYGNNTIIDLESPLETYSANAIAVAYASEGLPVVDPGPSKEVTLSTLGSNAGCDDIEGAMEKTDIISTYDLVSAIDGQTAVIITFPTRGECHGKDSSTSTGEANIFNCKKNDPTSGECLSYCSPVTATVYDQAENALQSTGFSPAGGTCLPWEVNVLELGDSDVWPNSSLAQGITVNGALGWIDIFLTPPVTTGGSPDGLPAFGYTTQNYAGGAASYMTQTAYKSYWNSLLGPEEE